MAPGFPETTAPMAGRRPGRYLPALVLLACWAAPNLGHAHLGSTKYLRVERLEAGAHVEASVDAVDASMELGLGEEPQVALLVARAHDIGRWLGDGVSVRGQEGACRSSPSPAELEERDGRLFATVQIDYACATPVSGLVLHDSTVFGDDPQHEAFVRIRWGADADARILRRGAQETAIGEPPSSARIFAAFLTEGALHLVTGYDHLLFLLALVLASGLVAVRKGRRRALSDVAWLVTAFTVGHSVTLAVAALGLVLLPSRLVESVIAASILLVAVHNLYRPDERRGVPAVAFAFGLVHGFGFSSVLAEQGLPIDRQVLALLSFNIGIEVAQLAFVAVVLWPLAWWAQSPSYRNVVVRGGSVLIGLMAIVWLVERIGGL